MSTKWVTRPAPLRDDAATTITEGKCLGKGLPKPLRDRYRDGMDGELFIPVLLGTPRQGRQSEHVAQFVHSHIAKRPEVTTSLIDVRQLPFPTDDAGESIKDPAFSAAMGRADALVIVAPEYNHGYPGILKHVLDTNLKEYIHKAVGICGVSAGPFGGARMIQGLLPILRELGLVTIFWDVNFGNVQDAFDASGNLVDNAYVRRTDKFLDELIWMATTLRHGREHVRIGAQEAAAS